MKYRVQFPPSAAREFGRLPREAQSQLSPLIDALASDPRPHGAKKLSGLEDCYRIRQGDFRIVYAIRESALIVMILRVGHRREVYEKLRELAKRRSRPIIEGSQ